MRYIPLCFIGSPGVGKGTFAKIICASLNLYHISIGDKLREAITAQSDLGERIFKKVSEGKLVPDDLINSVAIQEIERCTKQLATPRSSVNEETNKNCKEGYHGFLLDGYPRTVAQALFLDSYTRDHMKLSALQHGSQDCSDESSAFIKVVDITLDRDIAIEKLLGRRTCATCQANLNIAHIVRDTYDMPAILPERTVVTTPQQLKPGQESFNANNYSNNMENNNYAISSNTNSANSQKQATTMWHIVKNCALPLQEQADRCNPVLTQREDDISLATIQKRMDVHSNMVQPILDYYQAKGRLTTFSVQRGIKDAPALEDIITTQLFPYPP